MGDNEIKKKECEEGPSKNPKSKNTLIETKMTTEGLYIDHT